MNDQIINQLRADLEQHASALAAIRTRLRGTDLLHATVAQAAIDLRRVGAAICSDGVNLIQAQRLEAAMSRGVLNLPRG